MTVNTMHLINARLYSIELRHELTLFQLMMLPLNMSTVNITSFLS